MSHHFDTPTAREDPRLNLCDAYLFGGTGDRTVMAMTVNPEATLANRAPFRDEGLYTFHFANHGQPREHTSFTFRFDNSTAGDQRYTVRRVAGEPRGLSGDVIGNGATDTVAADDHGLRTYCGVVHDAFAGDAAALGRFKAAAARGSYEPEAFANRTNYFHDRTIAAIVLEVPNSLVSEDSQVEMWATVSLVGHASQQQVARWGLPLLTHMLLPDESREAFNRSRPVEDGSRFRDDIESTVAAYVRLARTATDPVFYARRVSTLLGSLSLPYQLGTPASFDYTGFNGRALRDNVMDNMLSLLTNSPLGTGIAPDTTLFDIVFPYLQPAQRAQLQHARSDFLPP